MLPVAVAVPQLCLWLGRLILGKFDLKDGAGYIGVSPSNPSTTRLPITSSIMDQTVQWLGTTMVPTKQWFPLKVETTKLCLGLIRVVVKAFQFSKYLLNYFFEKL